MLKISMNFVQKFNKKGERYNGWELDELLSQTLNAMQNVEDEIEKNIELNK